MSNAILIGLSQQMVLRRHMEIVANNLANVSTTGFKAETPVFEDYLFDSQPDQGPDQTLHFVNDFGIYRDFGEGQMITTGRPLDVAISGRGFFVVETPAGERYTRSGAFRVDDQGQIVTEDGYALLDDKGRPFSVTAGDVELSIARDGTVSAGEGQIGKLDVVRFDNEQALRKVGNNLFETEETPTPADTFRVLPGTLETSNVVPVLEMTKLIDISKAYTQTARLMETQGELTRKAIQTIGEGR